MPHTTSLQNWSSSEQAHKDVSAEEQPPHLLPGNGAMRLATSSDHLVGWVGPKLGSGEIAEP